MKNRRSFLMAWTGILGLFLGENASAKTAELTPEQVIKAWKDPAFRNKLTKEQWESLPPNPAGDIRGGEFRGNLVAYSGDDCSGNNCSGNNCSGNNCSGNNCSGNNCSGNSCSGNNCSGNNCSGRSCSSYPCGS